MELKCNLDPIKIQFRYNISKDQKLDQTLDQMILRLINS